MKSAPLPASTAAGTPEGPVPRVSVGMPLYNAERYVREAIESILAQSYEDFELVISDNASTDATEAICGEYAAGDRRIRYVRNERNLGAAKNFNRVFELARAPYFKWAAYDDVCAPTFIERCMTVLEREPAVILSYPKTVMIDAAGDRLGCCEDRLHLQGARPYQRLHKLVTSYNLCNPIFGVIRSDVLRRTSLIGPYIASDYILLVEMCLYGRFWEIPDQLFFRRDHEYNVRRLPLHQRATWFDTSARKRRHAFGAARLFLKQLASIRRARLSIDDKMLCYLQIGVWALRKWRDLGGRYKAAVKRRLGGAP